MNAHRKQLVSLAHPVYFSLLATVAAGIINTAWVSRLGGAAVAAVAVATNTENVLLGVSLVFASGTTVLVAHARGARDPAAVRAAVRGGWALCGLVTPVVVVGGLLLREPLARLVLGGGEGAALSLAVAYFGISLPGIAVFFAQNLVDGILKGAGDTRTPMRLALLANGLILACDPFLIQLYGVWVLPRRRCCVDARPSGSDSSCCGGTPCCVRLSGSGPPSRSGRRCGGRWRRGCPCPPISPCGRAGRWSWSRSWRGSG